MVTKTKTPPINPRVDQYQNNTGTDLEVLQSLEQSWVKNKGPGSRRNTANSLNWFRNIVSKNWRDIRTARMFRDRTLWKSPVECQVGKAYFYEYKAETVDFYDKYPLAFVINKYESKGHQYITALNMHWLPPALRMATFTAMLKLRTEKRYRTNTRLKLEWSVLKKMSEHQAFAHCVKSYRVDRFKSVMVEIPSASWELVLFLPLQRWSMNSNAEAWKL